MPSGEHFGAEIRSIATAPNRLIPRLYLTREHSNSYHPNQRSSSFNVNMKRRSE
jgi:hypothetical protein